MSRDLVIIVPMLGRAHRVKPLLESVTATVPDARVLFCTSSGDTDVHRAIAQAGRERIEVPYIQRGDYARKINAGYRVTTEPHLFCAADDLCFHAGWYEAALTRLGDGIGVVGTNDLGSPRVMAGDHATHSLVTRDYADRYGTIDSPGQIMHEGYWHEWVDDEMVETAKHRKAFAFAPDAHVEHLHPNWGKAPSDGLYQLQRIRMHDGARLHRQRRLLWT